MMTENAPAAPPDPDRLKAEIIELIETHQIGTDGRLPTERELAERLKASRWVVRRALNLLEGEGRIWRHVGRGTFVGTKPAAASAAFKHLVSDIGPMELVDARVAIEPELARRAALNASASQVRAIQHAANRCSKSRHLDEYEIWDEAFHQAIAAASGNAVLKAAFEGLNGLRRDLVWGTMRRAVLRPEVREFFSAQHDGIVRAIASREPAAAGDAMVQHLRDLELTYASIAAVRGKADAPQFGPAPEKIPES